MITTYKHSCLKGKAVITIESCCPWMSLNFDRVRPVNDLAQLNNMSHFLISLEKDQTRRLVNNVLAHLFCRQRGRYQRPKKSVCSSPGDWAARR